MTDPWGGGWDLSGLGSGQILHHHPPEVCAGRPCCLHNPSEHPLNTAPLYWRGRVMERICRHVVGHPDPDDLAWRRRTGRPAPEDHGCDGCCSGEGPGDDAG